MFSYEGKKVVLTGGASGVGAAAVELLAEAGCTDLTVIDRNEPTGPATAYVAADLSDPDSIDAACEAIGPGVHVLFNNAGVAGVHSSDFVMRVNYLGLRRLSEGLLPTMNRGGAIVNTASVAGQRWPQHLAEISELIAVDGWDEALAWIAEHGELVDPAPYEFSKEVAQVWTMHGSRRSYLDHGVRTNSVCPGVIDTPLLHDFRRHMTEKVIDWMVDQSAGILTPVDIARTLVMLGSDASAAMNGHNMVADHGFMAWFTTNQVDFAGLA
ncbi:MAG: SDR family oxidoreductase [Acidimicrobiaceae bacterium]|nr:SDR family oxidoreductase [Acidimicrobiaceae bacterium]